jgi:hypothetical protein
LQSVAAHDPIRGIYLGNFSALFGFLQSRSRLFETRVAAAIHCLAVFVDLKEH